MDEQNNLETPKPIQDSKNSWVIIISIVITALIFGGGVYAWQNSNLKTTEQSLRQQIVLLQNQINQLQQTQDNQKKLSNNKPIANNEEKNSNWKIYKNNSYKFSFNYPNSWIVSEKSGTYPDNSRYTNIIVENKNGGQFIVSPLGSYILFQDGIWNETQKNIIVDGKTALKTTYTPDPNQNWSGNLPSTRSKIELNKIPAGWNNNATINQIAGKDNNFSTLNKILDTFQFTN